jgi:hypothetical protein
MKVKALVISSLPIITLSLPLGASANNLTIRNYTNYDSTCKINNVCSDFLRDAGITRAHDLNHQIKESVVRLICNNSSNCTADVYMTSNCSGVKAATVVFDVNSGTKSVTHNPKSPFTVTSAYHSFEFRLAGGPR